MPAFEVTFCGYREPARYKNEFAFPQKYIPLLLSSLCFKIHLKNLYFQAFIKHANYLYFL